MHNDLARISAVLALDLRMGTKTRGGSRDGDPVKTMTDPLKISQHVKSAPSSVGGSASSPAAGQATGGATLLKLPALRAL